MLANGVHVTTETERVELKVHERRSGERTHGLPPPFNVVLVSSLCRDLKTRLPLEPRSPRGILSVSSNLCA
jgi:hypothetical protein